MAVFNPAATAFLVTSADLNGDYVASGLTTPTSANLTSTTAAGVGYASGQRVSVIATARTYTALTDTYVDLTPAGAYTYAEVANTAAAPTQVAGTLRLAKVVASAAAVTSVTDLRVTTLTFRNQLSFTADGAVQTSGAGQSGSVIGNARGLGATDLQVSRAGGTQVASGGNAVIAGGAGNVSNAVNASILGGSFNAATGGYSTIGGGGNNTASGVFSSIAGGAYCTVFRYGQQGRAAGRFSVPGDAQASSHVMRVATVDATPTLLTLDGAAASAQGRLTLGTNQTSAFRGVLIASTAAGAVAARWNLDGLITRGATAASARIVGTTSVTQTQTDAGASAWAVAVTADTTNGALSVTVTGAAATSIRWLLDLTGPELMF